MCAHVYAYLIFSTMFCANRIAIIITVRFGGLKPNEKSSLAQHHCVPKISLIYIYMYTQTSTYKCLFIFSLGTNFIQLNRKRDNHCKISIGENEIIADLSGTCQLRTEYF